jgi:two-component system sensor histidine kinase BarA
MSDLGITRLEPLQIAGVDGDPLKLEELVDRRALVEMIESFERLFNVPVRVVSSSGTTLAGTSAFSPICALVNEHSAGQKACAAVLEEVRRQKVVPISRLTSGSSGVARDSTGAITTPPPYDEGSGPPPERPSAAPISGVEAAQLQGTHRCFTGAVYRVISIEYDRRPIGQIVLGPYLPASVAEAPSALLAVDPEIDMPRVRGAFPGFTRLDAETIEQLGRHLATVLDVILFSGHKALLTSQMHLASIKESYRELSEKTEHLEEAYERLKELDRLKSNFLATVSHELRTPLTSIMGYGEMLAEGVAGELNEEQREFVETIRAKSEQLLGLIMSLLDLSKLESGTTAVRVGR